MLSSLREDHPQAPIELEIQNHPAWLGRVSGLKADKMLRGQKRGFLYILREGEQKGNYYISYTLPNLTIKHQPFNLNFTSEGWSYENSNSAGLYAGATIDEVLHLIMNCEKSECLPLVQLEKK